MTNFSTKIFKGLKRPQQKFIHDNSDIAKPASRKLEALSEIRDGSTGEITRVYLTVEAAVLSETGKCRCRYMRKYFQRQKDGM